MCRKNYSVRKRIYVLVFLIVFAFSVQLSARQENTAPASIYDMSIDELMDVEVGSVATLTHTKPRLIPAATTTITAKQIRESGARSMFELFDIYVPNLQWSRHHWESDMLGVRGIINDRNDKYLLLVNGRYMNDRTHFGVISELDMVALGDIHHIDVIRGPGSPMHGPGAISMVINIITYNSDTFQGTEVTGRLGAVEEFYSGELKYGRKNKDGDGGLFVYSGFGKYIGASKYDAPQVYPFFFPVGGGSATVPVLTIPGEGTKAGHPMTNTYVNRDNADALLPSMKLHLQYKKDNWDLWARLTRGGKQFAWAAESIARPPFGNGDTNFYTRFRGIPPYQRSNFYTYLQFTGFVGYKMEVTEDLDIDYAFSYQSITNVQEREIRYGFNYREDNYYAKILLKWQPNDQHKIAFGSEYLLNDLGLLGWNGLGYKAPKFRGSSTGTPTPFMNPNVQLWGWNVLMPTWRTEMWSFLGEWQWNINDKWTTFVGGRVDDHTYVEKMFSPRAALIHTPNEKDTYKLMFTRSVRTNFEEEMKAEWDNTHRNSSPEKLTSWELRYERKNCEQLDFGLSAYHNKMDAISWSNSQTTNIGSYATWGIEGEIDYHTEKDRVLLSHGYTKLIWFKGLPGVSQSISAMPYNYGDDLTNWSNHNTKLIYQRKLNDKLTFDASLRVYWGFNGLRAYNDYMPYSTTQGSNTVPAGWRRTYRGSYFLDLGLNYKHSENLSFNLTGYNLLGILNKDFNKRNYIETGSSNGSDFRSHAPAVAVSMTYYF